MRSEVQKYRGLNRFLEVISKDAVDMAFFWNRLKKRQKIFYFD